MGDAEAGRAAADRFFNALLEGDLGQMQAACAAGSVLWINVTEKERPLEASLPGFASLRGRMPDLRLEDVRRRGVPGGFIEQHVLTGTTPSDDRLRVVGCFVGTIEAGLIVRLEEYVDSAQAGALSALLKGGS